MSGDEGIWLSNGADWGGPRKGRGCMRGELRGVTDDSRLHVGGEAEGHDRLHQQRQQQMHMCRLCCLLIAGCCLLFAV